MLAVLGPRPAEQVVVVLATGSGKTLVVMVGAALDDGQTTILILPTVALRGDMLDRLKRVGIQPHVWSPAGRQPGRPGPLVIVSAEAACTYGFLEYAHRLVDGRKLARIVVDECHLTITAGSYRPSMARLAWYVRQLRTQTVWLTATLPPAMQEAFVEHNKLVRPQIVRESTNRPNIQYHVWRAKGTVNERAVQLERVAWRERTDLFRHERERMILYCPTKKLVAELAELIGCPSYTADSGTEAEKGAIIARWLATTDPPAIVATSALGPGFDYPHVRQVIHVGAPNCMTDFSQESGRAGRDGQVAESIVLLGAEWAPAGSSSSSSSSSSSRGSPDEEAMRLYLGVTRW